MEQRQTASWISEKRDKIQQGAADEEELMPEQRGAEFSGMRIHSPDCSPSGHHIFAAKAKGLTLPWFLWSCFLHDRVNLGIKEVVKRHELVYGLNDLHYERLEKDAFWVSGGFYQ